MRMSRNQKVLKPVSPTDKPRPNRVTHGLKNHTELLKIPNRKKGLIFECVRDPISIHFKDFLIAATPVGFSFRCKLQMLAP
jgi:hypothetical protein